MRAADQDAGQAGSRASFAYCSWCKTYSGTARLVQIEDAGSTFGARSLSACSGCRKMHRLVPVAEQQP